MRVILLIAILLFNTVHVAADTLEVLAVEYPPFTSEKVSGNGLSFRLLKQHIKSAEGLTITPVFLPPARVQRRMNSGNWCVSFYPANDLPDTKFVAFDDRTIRISLFLKRDDPQLGWKQLKQLYGYRVALLRSDKRSKFYQRIVDAGLEIVLVDDVEQGLKMLQLNRVDAALGDEHLRSVVGLGYNNLEGIVFSETTLLETQIGVFVNLNCAHADLF